MTPSKIKDERIQKRQHQICAPLFPIMLIVTSISLIIKIALNIHPLLYTLEIIALIASITYYTASTAYNKVLFVKGKDEAITSIKNTAKNYSYEICTNIFLFGCVILFFNGASIPFFPDNKYFTYFHTSSCLVYPQCLWVLK